MKKLNKDEKSEPEEMSHFEHRLISELERLVSSLDRIESRLEEVSAINIESGLKKIANQLALEYSAQYEPEVHKKTISDRKKKRAEDNRRREEFAKKVRAKPGARQRAKKRAELAMKRAEEAESKTKDKNEKE